MKEKLHVYALMAEIISAIAIVFSLVFVGFQIRENTISSQADTYQGIAAMDVEILLEFSSTPDKARIINIYRESPESLVGDEKAQGANMFLVEVRHVENLFLQHQMGMLSEESWGTREALVTGMILTPAFSSFLQGESKKYFSGIFIDYALQIRSENK